LIPDIRPVATRAEARTFLTLPALLGGEAAGWGVPLHFEVSRFFNPAFNGYHADHSLARWVAWRDGRPVARIAAAHRPGALAGNFGFLALPPDPALLAALLATAGDWLRTQGATTMQGPFNLSINHEAGAQLSGFDRPPMIRLPRTPPWLPALLDAAGLTPAQDLLAHSLDVATEPHTARFAALLARWPGRDQLRLRPLDPAHHQRDIARFTHLFNAAWAPNWGAEPVGPAEAATIARVMRPMTRAGAILFAEWQGETIGVASVIPNLDEATIGLNGRLLPFGWARLAPLLLTGRSRTGRLPVIGIAPAWQRHPAGAMALGLLLSACIAAARTRGWHTLDMSWILPQNLAMRQICHRLGAPETGRWRLWQTPLHPPTAS
jgi:hypothetical protein